MKNFTFDALLYPNGHAMDVAADNLATRIRADAADDWTTLASELREKRRATQKIAIEAILLIPSIEKRVELTKALLAIL